METALLVLEYHIKRTLVKTLNQGIHKVKKGQDIFDVGSEVGLKALEIVSPKNKQNNKSLEQCLAEQIKKLELPLQNGIMSNLSSLDNILEGFKKQEYTILAARPGMGKTSLLTHLYISTIDQGQKAIFFNLEMGQKAFIDRILAYVIEIPINKLRNHNLTDNDWQKLYATTNDYLKEDSKVVSEGGLTITDIKVMLRQMKAEQGVDIVFIDYLQLLAPENSSRFFQNREQEVAQISRSLKEISINLDIHIMCAAQLNREVESRPGHQPRNFDLRESGSLEQDADNILLLNRLEEYDINEDSDGESTQGVMDIIVAKQRNGPTGKAKVGYNKAITKVEDGG